MKTTVVPAQVTTVEDKIAGNLGVSQLLLLVAPVFAGSILFVILPPFFSYATYKVVLIVCMAALCSVLAIRIKGQILLLWIATIIRYNLRPKYYIFNKNDTYLRQVDATTETGTEKVAATSAVKPTFIPQLPRLSTAELAKIEHIISNPAANLRFKTDRKGGLSVHITEVQ